jgi:hypothetical protein
VERFCTGLRGVSSEAAQAIDALEHECVVLRRALREYLLAEHAKQVD